MCLSRRQRARPASPSRPSAAAPPRLLRLRGLPQHIVSAVLRHAREDVSRSPSRPPPRLAEGLDPSFRDLLESWCAARRSTPSPLRSTNDAVAVLADVTVIRGQPIRHWMQSRDAKSQTAVPPDPPLDAPTLRPTFAIPLLHVSWILVVSYGDTKVLRTLCEEGKQILEYSGRRLSKRNSWLA